MKKPPPSPGSTECLKPKRNPWFVEVHVVFHFVLFVVFVVQIKSRQPDRNNDVALKETEKTEKNGWLPTTVARPGAVITTTTRPGKIAPHITTYAYEKFLPAPSRNAP